MAGTLELLRRGQLPADFWDWRDGADFSFRGAGDAEEDALAAAALEKATAAAAAAAGVASASATDGDVSASGAQSAASDRGGTPTLEAPSDAIDGSVSAAEASPGDAMSTETVSQTAADQGGIVGLELTIPFQLGSADGLRTEFTNYVRGYSGALDYVWYEPTRLRVLREVPLPAKLEVESFLPSQRFPSDHLSVRHSVSLMPYGVNPSIISS